MRTRTGWDDVNLKIIVLVRWFDWETTLEDVPMTHSWTVSTIGIIGSFNKSANAAAHNTHWIQNQINFSISSKKAREQQRENALGDICVCRMTT